THRNTAGFRQIPAPRQRWPLDRQDATCGRPTPCTLEAAVDAGHPTEGDGSPLSTRESALGTVAPRRRPEGAGQQFWNLAVSSPSSIKARALLVSLEGVHHCNQSE